MLFGYLPVYQCDDKACAAVRRSYFFEELLCIICCIAVVVGDGVLALGRVDSCATFSLARSVSSLVGFTWLHLFRHFLPCDDMGYDNEMR
jgi:hypothetical protein